jgi:hypothetical protein
MRPEWIKAIEEMRAEGYAVGVVTPDELGVITREDAEEWMVDCAYDCITITEQDRREQYED